jgi:hypothetical protein
VPGGHFDVIAVDTLGREWFYPGDLTSGAGNPIQIGAGWSADYTSFGILDLTSDGHYDILARYAPTDILKLYTGDATGGHSNDQGTQTGACFNTHTFVALLPYDGDPQSDHPRIHRQPAHLYRQRASRLDRRHRPHHRHQLVDGERVAGEAT